MDNDFRQDMHSTQTRIDRRLDELEYREERLTAWLRRGIYIILSLFMVTLAIFIGKYILLNREAPQSYNELQLRIWREAVAKDPGNPTYHANLGYIYYRIGSSNQALAELDKAISIDKKHVTAHYYRALIYRKQGDDATAIKDLKVAIDNATSGNRFLPAYDLGNLYVQRKDYKKALEAFKTATADNPVIWNSHYALARVYEKLGDKQQALNEYTTAAKFNPESSTLKKAIERLQGK